ncbi:MAG TPA: PaaI family thioesterase [Candidatus Mcinerneyibacteriales bacterium]|nr:PaaI family thioesterase [Candidatus Mcinerneyibacteriales bacterium]
MDNGLCFVCGQENEQGMKVVFETDPAGEARADLVVSPAYQGYTHVTHGGIVATLLDEVMAKACLAAGLDAFTAEISVKFLKPLPVGSRVRVEGKICTRRHRLITTKAFIYVDREPFATADAKFFVR